MNNKHFRIVLVAWILLIVMAISLFLFGFSTAYASTSQLQGATGSSKPTYDWLYSHIPDFEQIALDNDVDLNQYPFYSIAVRSYYGTAYYVLFLSKENTLVYYSSGFNIIQHTGCVIYASVGWNDSNYEQITSTRIEFCENKELTGINFIQDPGTYYSENYSFLSSNHNIIYRDSAGEISTFFQKAPMTEGQVEGTLKIITPALLKPTLTQVLSLVPLLITFLVSLMGLRKGLKMLFQRLRRA